MSFLDHVKTYIYFRILFEKCEFRRINNEISYTPLETAKSSSVRQINENKLFSLKFMFLRYLSLKAWFKRSALDMGEGKYFFSSEVAGF